MRFWSSFQFLAGCMLCLFLAYYLSMLSWSWWVNPKSERARYLVAHQLPHAMPGQTANNWYWLDQKKTRPLARNNNALNPERLGLKLLGLVREVGCNAQNQDGTHQICGVAVFSVKRNVKVVGLHEIIMNNITLSRIDRNAVVITNGIQDAVVYLEQTKDNLLTHADTGKTHQPYASPDRKAYPARENSSNRPSGNVRAAVTDPELRARVTQLKRDLQRQPLKAVREISSIARPRPLYHQGKIQGVEVQPQGNQANQALFRALGLQSGDIILGINGLSVEQVMHDPAQQAALLGADQLQVRIKRNNVVMEYPLAW